MFASQSPYQNWTDYWSNQSQNMFSNWSNSSPLFGNASSQNDYMKYFVDGMQNMFRFANLPSMPPLQNLFAPDVSQFMSMFNFANAKFSFEEVLKTPLFRDLEQAYMNNDKDKQKEILSRISDYWCEQCNFWVIKHIDMLKWNQQYFELNLNRSEINHFENEYSRDFRHYLMKLNGLYASSISMLENFKGFDQDLSNQLADYVLSSNTEVQDINELFNVWTDLFEKLYKQYTLSKQYQLSFAMLVEAIAEVKQALQKIVDKNIEAMGLPSNREMSSTHKRINELGKQVRKLSKASHSSTLPKDGLDKDGLDQLNKAHQGEVVQLQKSMTSLVNRVNALEKLLNEKLAADEDDSEDADDVKVTPPKSSTTVAKTRKTRAKK